MCQSPGFRSAKNSITCIVEDWFHSRRETLMAYIVYVVGWMRVGINQVAGHYPIDDEVNIQKTHVMLGCFVCYDFGNYE